MGLRKNNYKIKSMNMTLVTAYAKINSMHIEGENGVAEFYVHKNRESIDNYNPVEKVSVRFKVDRKENPFVTAYNTAKSQKEINVIEEDRITKKVISMPFYGFEDDIIE